VVFIGSKIEQLQVERSDWCLFTDNNNYPGALSDKTFSTPASALIKKKIFHNIFVSFPIVLLLKDKLLLIVIPTVLPWHRHRHRRGVG
jgi:hypothetical protein